MTVGKASSRRPTASGCGSSISTRPSKPSTPSRPSVSTGCGTSVSTGGWKPKANTGGKTGKTTGLSERAKKELEKTKKTGGRTSVSTGCGSSAPSKPAKPSKPVSPPVRTGC